MPSGAAIVEAFCDLFMQDQLLRVLTSQGEGIRRVACIAAVGMMRELCNAVADYAAAASTEPLPADAPHSPPAGAPHPLLVALVRGLMSKGDKKQSSGGDGEETKEEAAPAGSGATDVEHMLVRAMQADRALVAALSHSFPVPARRTLVNLVDEESQALATAALALLTEAMNVGDLAEGFEAIFMSASLFPTAARAEAVREELCPVQALVIGEILSGEMLEKLSRPAAPTPTPVVPSTDGTDGGGKEQEEVQRDQNHHDGGTGEGTGNDDANDDVVGVDDDEPIDVLEEIERSMREAFGTGMEEENLRLLESGEGPSLTMAMGIDTAWGSLASPTAGVEAEGDGATAKRLVSAYEFLQLLCLDSHALLNGGQCVSIDSPLASPTTTPQGKPGLAAASVSLKKEDVEEEVSTSHQPSIRAWERYRREAEAGVTTSLTTWPAWKTLNAWKTQESPRIALLMQVRQQRMAFSLLGRTTLISSLPPPPSLPAGSSF